MMNNVYINGILQRPAYDYTVSGDGSSYTFHIPPAKGDEVKVVAFPQQENTIAFHTGRPAVDEMLKITPDGFYVRGVKVPADEKEAETVYKAFKRFLVESELRRAW